MVPASLIAAAALPGLGLDAAAVAALAAAADVDGVAHLEAGGGGLAGGLLLLGRGDAGEASRENHAQHRNA